MRAPEPEEDAGDDSAEDREDAALEFAFEPIAEVEKDDIDPNISPVAAAIEDPAIPTHP